MPVVPSKPQSGRYSISELTRVVNAIIDYLYYYKIRPGNGIKISENARSIIISLDETSQMNGNSGSQSTFYNGPFAVNFSGKNTLRINGGFASCNGTFIPVAGKTLGIRNEYLCVETELIEDSGIWKQPVINYGVPDKLHFPIAYIETGKSGTVIHSCRCPVAVFIDTAVCPVEEEWTREKLLNG